MPQNVAKWMTKTTSQSPDGFQPGGYFSTIQVPPESFSRSPEHFDRDQSIMLLPIM